MSNCIDIRVKNGKSSVCVFFVVFLYALFADRNHMFIWKRVLLKKSYHAGHMQYYKINLMIYSFLGEFVKQGSSSLQLFL